MAKHDPPTTAEEAVAPFFLPMPEAAQLEVPPRPLIVGLEDQLAQQVKAIEVQVKQIEGIVDRVLGEQPHPYEVGPANDLPDALVPRCLFHADAMHVAMLRLAAAISQLDRLG